VLSGAIHSLKSLTHTRQRSAWNITDSDEIGDCKCRELGILV